MRHRTENNDEKSDDSNHDRYLIIPLNTPCTYPPYAHINGFFWENVKERKASATHCGGRIRVAACPALSIHRDDRIENQGDKRTKGKEN